MNLSYSTAHKIPKGLWKISCNKICFGRRGAIKVNEVKPHRTLDIQILKHN